MAKDYFLASGRWDNVVLVIDLEKAIDPANDGTPNAVVNRLRVTPDIQVDGQTQIASGQPIIVTIAPDHQRAYISNHSGQTPAAEAEEFQHGHAGSVTVVDLTKALDPEANETLHAVQGWIDSQGFGATGFALLPGGTHAALAHAEAEGFEDGGHHINIIDLAAGKVTHRVAQAVGSGEGCPPTELARSAPDPRFGCYPDTNGVTASPLGGPQGLIFTANGGSNDVSVIDIQRALAAEDGAEIGRIPVQAGGFGITTSPDGKLVAHASREDPRDGREANTISIIDVEKAGADPASAEVARIRVGTDDANEPSRPFVAAFTPDGTQIVTTNFRTNNIDIIDVGRAVAGQDATVARIPLETGSDDPSRPRGIAITPDGQYAAITGAPPKNGPNSSMVWIVDLKQHKPVGRVTQIGSESYMIGHFAQ
ncbi:YncE family protein [Paracoccus laeviglucosivorans]|nr:YncE family protein [Paracoccus laeviglucosivorans]